VFYSEEEKNVLKCCLSDLMAVVEWLGGVHPRMAGVLDKVFSCVKKVGSDIGKHKRRRLSQQTWKDSNANTMYLDWLNKWLKLPHLEYLTQIQLELEMRPSKYTSEIRSEDLYMWWETSCDLFFSGSDCRCCHWLSRTTCSWTGSIVFQINSNQPWWTYSNLIALLPSRW
jgi:hypothetical protein